jgi:hypothetical protein
LIGVLVDPFGRVFEYGAVVRLEDHIGKTPAFRLAFFRAHRPQFFLEPHEVLLLQRNEPLPLFEERALRRCEVSRFELVYICYRGSGIPYVLDCLKTISSVYIRHGGGEE